MKYSAKSPETIQNLFNSIAKRYDRMNFILSFGLFRLWNRRLISAATKDRSKYLLDLCAGTGEIAFGCLKKDPLMQATLLDFSHEMLEVARQKGNDLLDRCSFVIADAQKIPYENGFFDAVTIAYGIRNVKEPQECTDEAYRVLKSGGIFAILELTRPSFFLLRFMHYLFLKSFLPLVGFLVAENESAYRYLSDSINHFSPPQKLRNMLERAGFEKIETFSLLGGIATLLVAKK